jgi:hypothetical protein
MIEAETATETGINSIRTLLFARENLTAFSFSENFNFPHRAVKTKSTHKGKYYEPSPWAW